MFNEITTSRLLLRRLLDTDREALFAYRSDPEVSRYQTWVPISPDEVTTFMEQMLAVEPNLPGTWFQLGITLKDSGQLIGDTGMHFPEDNPEQAEIGITLAKAHQGKGYATEALTSVLDYLFTQVNKHRVYASTDPRNRGAIALLERCHLRREAHFRRSLWFKGEWADDLIYAMLREEWLDRTKLTQ